MWGWIIQVTIISLLLIFLLHYLYSFFKTTLTSPKLKDLVNKPQEKYNTIYNSLQSAGNGGSYNLGKGKQIHANDNSAIYETSASMSASMSASTSTSMKDELKKYLNDLNSNSNSNNNNNNSNNNNNNNNNNNSNNNNTNVSSDGNGNTNNEINSVYSPDNILKSIGGANGISTRVNNTPNYMQNTDKIGSSTEAPDFGTPSMSSSSYASAYSSY